MYKVRTHIRNFRFNAIHQKKTYIVNWYKLLEAHGEQEGQCLTEAESKILLHYFSNNTNNFFEDGKDRFTCSQDDGPYSGIHNLLPSKLSFPKRIVIRRKPELFPRDGDIYNCMDIELLLQDGKPNHSYNLEFDIIGEFEENGL